MGTKANPGKFDCYGKAESDTELFTLVSTDELMPHIVRYWAWLKAGNPKRWHESEHMNELRQTARVNEKLSEALTCADRAQQQRIARVRVRKV